MSAKKQRYQEPITLSIEGLSHDGRGVARDQDKTVFVFGGLPGETIDTQILRTHRRFNEGTALRVQSPSPDRVPPKCDHFAVCGGCQLQHLDANKQIEQKQALVAQQLSHINCLPKKWLPPLKGPVWGYRQKARLSVKYIIKKDTVAVGFREQKNSKIALIDVCHILDPRIGNHIHSLRTLIQSLSCSKEIAQIEVAATQTTVALIFRHLSPIPASDLDPLKNFCKENGFDFYCQSAGPDSVIKIDGSSTEQDLTYDLPDQQLTFQFHPLDFTQVNQTMNQKMVNQALELLDPKPTDAILDLFCGLGNFSLPLAQKAESVFGVEGCAKMVQKAKKNASINQLDNVNFVSYDLSHSLETAPWASNHYDKILLDPPRSGAFEIVSNIRRFKAKQILYVSCHAATFCRDAQELIQKQGYELTALGAMDMFPHTAHVELMGLFTLPS